MTKYNNKKVVLNGITFDSQKEARRYRDLSLLERVGEIKELELQRRSFWLSRLSLKMSQDASQQ